MLIQLTKCVRVTFGDYDMDTDYDKELDCCLPVSSIFQVEKELEDDWFKFVVAELPLDAMIVAKLPPKATTVAELPPDAWVEHKPYGFFTPGNN